MSMGNSPNSAIIAVITTEKDKVLSGGAPVFIAANQDTLQEMATKLERIMDASAHEVSATTLIIVAR